MPSRRDRKNDAMARWIGGRKGTQEIAMSSKTDGRRWTWAILNRDLVWYVGVHSTGFGGYELRVHSLFPGLSVIEYVVFQGCIQ